jgi:4-carboxymuconolactone decarboxylase
MFKVNVGLQACLFVLGVLFVATVPPLSGEALPDRPGGTRPVPLSKPRVAPLPEAQWTDTHKQLVAKYLPDGRPGNSFKTLLNVPELVDGTMPFHNYVTRDSSLSPRHRELLILRTGWLHGSDVVWRERAPAARKAGLTTEDLRRIAQGADAGGWDRFEANLLRLADQMFRNSYVNDALFNSLSASYDTCHMMDAALTVGNFTSLSLLYNSLGVQPDQAPADDRMPMDIPYRIDVPQREAVTLKAPRAEPMAGPGANNPRTFGLCPKLAAPRSTGSNYVNRMSKLSTTGRERDRELLILRTGWNSQSEYEWSEHVGSVGQARKRGLPVDRIPKGPDAEGWDPFEATLLRAADEMYRDAIVSDRTWNALAQRYDTRTMIDAVITSANYRMVSLALNVLGVQVNPGEERLPALPAREPAAEIKQESNTRVRLN